MLLYAHLRSKEHYENQQKSPVDYVGCETRASVAFADKNKSGTTKVSRCSIIYMLDYP